MKRFKQIFLSTLGILVGLLILVFGLLNTQYVQNYAKEIVIEELQKKLDTELGIGHLYFRPFNVVVIDSLYVLDRENKEILLAKNIYASLDLYQLFKQNIIISSARLSNFNVNLSKTSKDSTLNIQFIIDAFEPKEENQQKEKINFQINAINLDEGSFSYNVLDQKNKTGIFDENHISVNDLHAKLALKSLLSDSLNIQVRTLSLKEKSGFEVTDFIGKLITQDKKVSVLGFELHLPNSKIQISKLDMELPKQSADSIQKHSHENDIKLDFALSPSCVTPSDIAAFVPELKKFVDKAYIKAEISGYQHNLNMSDLTVSYGQNIKLIANAQVVDWFEDADTYLAARVSELSFSGLDIEMIANGFSKTNVAIAEGIKNQKKITFKGDLSGYMTQLTAFGNLATDHGSVNTDVLLGFNKKDKVFSYAKGKVYTTNFNLGHLLGNDNLGMASFDMNVDIDKPVYQELEGEVKGIINNFDFKEYSYKDIEVDINYANKTLSGILNINDENGIISINGLLDTSKKESPKLNISASANNLQLGNLHLLQNMDNSFLALDLDANFSGSSIDNAEGYVSIKNLDFIKGDQQYKLNNIRLSATGDTVEKNRRIELNSDLVSGFIEGESNLLSFVDAFKYMVHQYLPALFSQNKLKPKQANNFKFHFDINNSEALSKIANLPVTFYKSGAIGGYFNSYNDKFKVNIKTPHIEAGGVRIISGYVDIGNAADEISATIKALTEGKNNMLNDITVNINSANNTINTVVDYLNTSKNRTEAKLNLLAEFDYLSPKDGLRTRLTLDESKMHLNNTDWKLNKATITINKNMVDVDNFWLHTEDYKQELKINGKYAPKDPLRILKTQLKDIDLEYLFNTLAIDALKFGGYASGDIFLSSIEQKPYANTRLEVTDFKFNNTELGNLNLFSELDEQTNEVLLNGTVTSKEKKETLVNGVIDPINQQLSIHFDADSIDIGFLYAYAESIFDNIGGRASGQVHLHGDFSNVTVEGVAQVMDGNIGIKFLNTNYTFSDVIYLREGLIFFNDMQMKDKFGNVAYASGKIVHDYFQNIMYHIELDAEKFLVYNASEETNPIFYGQVFGSGKGVLGGDEREINIDINMKTKENTLVRMNFMEDEISEYSFVTYKEPKSTQTEETVLKQDMLRPITASSDMSINMNFYIDATPDATVELIMDPIGGDILRAAGSGAMQFIWSSKLEPQLYGTYNVSRGSYNFTFQRIMERKFAIQEGSTIQFRGDPFQANLDVNAVYKVTASLNDLDKGLVEQSGQSSIPVNCILNLTGPLMRPNVGLDVKFPTANPEVARQIKSYMDTEDMINKQVTYLLLLSKFMTPESGDVDHPSSDFAVVASATLSNQLTKIISQVDNRWQLGTHIRLSDAELTSTEVELLLSSQLLDDRLLISGSFGYRDDPYVNNNAVITDVDVEYLLNSAGTWRIKAYNHYNEKYYYMQDKGSVQTQGVGVIYRRDFDHISELNPFRKKSKVPVNDSIYPVLPDSIAKGSSLSSFIKFKK